MAKTDNPTMQRTIPHALGTETTRKAALMIT